MRTADQKEGGEKIWIIECNNCKTNIFKFKNSPLWKVPSPPCSVITNSRIAYFKVTDFILINLSITVLFFESVQKFVCRKSNIQLVAMPILWFMAYSYAAVNLVWGWLLFWIIFRIASVDIMAVQPTERTGTKERPPWAIEIHLPILLKKRRGPLSAFLWVRKRERNFAVSSVASFLFRHLRF